MQVKQSAPGRGPWATQCGRREERRPEEATPGAARAAFGGGRPSQGRRGDFRAARRTEGEQQPPHPPGPPTQGREPPRRDGGFRGPAAQLLTKPELTSASGSHLPPPPEKGSDPAATDLSLQCKRGPQMSRFSKG